MKLKPSKLYMFYQYLCLYIFAEKLREKKRFIKKVFSQRFARSATFLKVFITQLYFLKYESFGEKCLLSNLSQLKQLAQITQKTFTAVEFHDALSRKSAALKLSILYFDEIIKEVFSIKISLTFIEK